jgi:hypothetical protein
MQIFRFAERWVKKRKYEMIRLAVGKNIGKDPICNVGIAMAFHLFCFDGIAYEGGD